MTANSGSIRNAVGYNDKPQILIKVVHSAWELPSLLTADEFQVGPEKLQVVASFCYLGDMLPTGGGCVLAVTTCLKTTWKKFRELNYHFSHPTTSPTRPVAMFKALPYRATCSMPVKLGH